MYSKSTGGEEGTAPYVQQLVSATLLSHVYVALQYQSTAMVGRGPVISIRQPYISYTLAVSRLGGNTTLVDSNPMMLSSLESATTLT